MIVDTLAHCAQYTSLHPLFPAAFAYLQQFDPSTPDGTYELDGKRLFASVQRYETAPVETRKWEAHQVYIDIQYVVSGRERMGYAPVTSLRPETPYNEVKDVEKFAGEGIPNPTPVVIPAGSFAIFFPHDGHQPGCMVDQPEPVVKVVIKVRQTP